MSRLMRKFSYLLVLSLSCSLSACVSHSTDYERQLAQTSSCCDQLQTIHYHPIKYDKLLTVQMGGKKQAARQFSTGKSYFAAIELPAFTSAYEIKIQSLPINKKLFWPNVQILDANFQVIKEIDAKEFAYSNGDLKNSFFINQDLGYRYLIIYTNPQLAGQASEARQVGTNDIYLPVGTGLVSLSSGFDKKQQITSSAGGILQVKLKKYELQKLP